MATVFETLLTRAKAVRDEIAPLDAEASLVVILKALYTTRNEAQHAILDEIEADLENAEANATILPGKFRPS